MSKTNKRTKEADFKRPNHADFLDSSELKKMEFSGIRHNSLISAMEIWTLGDLRGSMPDHEVLLYPEKFNSLYADIFGLASVEVEGVKPKDQFNTKLILPN